MRVCRGRKNLHEYLSVYIEICLICNINYNRCVLLIKSNLKGSIAI